MRGVPTGQRRIPAGLPAPPLTAGNGLEPVEHVLTDRVSDDTEPDNSASYERAGHDCGISVAAVA